MSAELEQRLDIFFQQEREHGRAVSNLLLQREARRLAILLRLSPTFKASSMFIRRWKKRHNITLRRGTNSAQTRPQDNDEILLEFSNMIMQLRLQHQYPADRIINVDETMIRFDTPSNYSNNTRGEKAIRIKNTNADKRGVTVILAVTAEGHKLPAVMIFKEQGGAFGPRVALRIAGQVPSNIRARATSSGWNGNAEMEWWIENVLPWSMNSRLLLIMDLANMHTSEGTLGHLRERNVDVVFVPAGCTSIVQPVDVGIVKQFKSRVRNDWEEWMRLEHERENTRAGNIRQPSREDLMHWVGNSWAMEEQNTIRATFSRCRIPIHMTVDENQYITESSIYAGNMYGLDLLIEAGDSNAQQ